MRLSEAVTQPACAGQGQRGFRLDVSLVRRMARSNGSQPLRYKDGIKADHVPMRNEGMRGLVTPIWNRRRAT